MTREANENMWYRRRAYAFLQLLYYEKRRLALNKLSPWRTTCNGNGEAAALLRDGSEQAWRKAWRARCHLPRRSRRGSPRTSCASTAVYARTGFQGGLQSYRVGRVPRLSAELQLFAGRTIDVPSLFLSGKSDWGVYQRAGSLDGMKRACTKFEGVELLDGAGHWVQQEQAALVAARLIRFLRR